MGSGVGPSARPQECCPLMRTLDSCPNARRGKALETGAPSARAVRQHPRYARAIVVSDTVFGRPSGLPL